MSLLRQAREFLLVICCAASFAAGFSATAQEEGGYLLGTNGGQALAATVRSFRPAENTSWRGVMKITRHRKTTNVPVANQVIIDGLAEWKVIYTGGGTNGIPMEKLVITHSTHGPGQYRYAKAAGAGEQPGEPRAISGAELTRLGGFDPR